MKNCVNNHLSSDEVDLSKRTYVGEGRDAVVYAAPNNMLYKVYRKIDRVRYDPFAIRDEYGVRIDKAKPKSMSISHMDYIDAEDVKLFTTTAIEKAASRQKDIKLSSLPVAPLFIDGSFRGCILKRHKKCGQLHTLFPFLTDKRKIKILRNVLDMANELVKHNIYPTDLANRKGGLESNELSHSNILLDPKLNPHIIDLDGKSAYYTEKPSDYHYHIVYNNIATLIIETLLNIDTSSDFSEYEIDILRKELISRGLDKSLTETLIDGSYVEEKDVRYVIEEASKGKLILRP